MSYGWPRGEADIRLRRKRDQETVEWRECLECGNRFRAGKRGYRVNWCSTGCETASMRRQRDEIETSLLRTRWFLN